MQKAQNAFKKRSLSQKGYRFTPEVKDHNNGAKSELKSASQILKVTINITLFLFLFY